MKATRLRCAYLNNPIGIDIQNPLLTWNASGGIRQTAYEIRTSLNGKPDWNTGIVSSSSMHAVYEGTTSSRDIVMWSVRLYDENGVPGEWSSKQMFEIGLLEISDWKAQWISGVNTDKKERLPADYYRKNFSLHGEVKKARLYATAHGIYEAYLNGKRVGDIVLAPGCTQYDKHLYYQTYDVTDMLAEENAIIFVTGDGWYKGKLGYDGEEYFFGNQTKLFAQLEITYDDGRREVIGTDDSFEWCNDGPVRENDLKDGIKIDCRYEPGFSEKAKIVHTDCCPTASNAPVVKEHECFTPEIIRTPTGKTILDFGQNMAGYILFRGRAGKGQKIILTLGETLDQGELTQSNFTTIPERGKSIRQQIKIIFNDSCAPDYPKFFYSGFRYALAEGLENIRAEDFTAVAVYSDIEYGGSFCCSDENINQFVKNTVWSQKSNFVDVPTDCPQREKAGWTGDAQIFARTAAYFADTAAFYRKWLKDVRDCQREDGRVDNVCPKVQKLSNQDALNGSVGWADAAVIIPYTLWKLYGDTSFIIENFELMHGWMQYVIHMTADKSYYNLPDGHPMKSLFESTLIGESPYSKYLIESGMHWGEWAEPSDVAEYDFVTELVRPKQEENTAYLHYTMRLLAEMWKAAGKENDAAICEEYSEGARQAYLYHFVQDDDIPADRQAKLVRPLTLGLLEGKTKENVARHLNDVCRKRAFKIGTGFLSTPFILPVLAENGYLDTAYKMLKNTEEPGWMAMVKQGATTVWENYNGYDEAGHPLKLSYNHYSPGAVCEFLFSHVAGIRIAGENRFLIKPYPYSLLEEAYAEYMSPYGIVKSGWKIQAGKPVFDIDVPSNCIVCLETPDGKKIELKAGRHII
ncbi:hypothetical protein GCM10008910_26530 [Faecalicatena orotica]|uniref:alpha-L-rhamnosidase n=1 Tax=Faecalicatena orotica TaxID=1544 RepID=A0A2Y9BL12_9FIRM|nr:family 78 glycoside hydrolase catalytic domain [Faecalicatena orotica]PWJ22564.1 alpha-L-rhamnosidase [Faecalicatena orotica]SSA58233.1 alpha-L-rhamnosidase [Faecalicatena orotica]